MSSRNHLRCHVPVSRTEARTIECPYCHAEVGAKCIGKRGVREAVHLERIHAFAETLGVNHG
jgi:MoaA/NifB/PqqE/SkfB family radical SAM enzyme